MSIVFDAHCHVWPDHIAPLALQGRVPGMEPIGDGTIAGARASMARSGVDRSVVMGIADHARHVHRVNEFIGNVGAQDESLVPFGTVHLDLDVDENLNSLREHGVVGIKLHPLYQGMSLDDPRLFTILEAIGSEFPVITHVGAGGTAEANERSNPRMLAEIIRTFPDLRLIACHFGGFHQLDEAEQEVVGMDVMLETSWPPTLAGLDRQRVIDVITAHGTNRVIFGSDWPMADPGREIEVIRGLGFSEEETAGILGGNLHRLVFGDAQ